MTYSYRLFDSLAAVDLDAWEQVHQQAGASISIDPRFLRTIESSMKAQNCRLWYLLVNEGIRPVACAVLTAMNMDLSDVVDPNLAGLLRRLPRSLPPRKLGIMFCGLPISTGHPVMALADVKAAGRIVPLVDEALRQLAATTGMSAAVYRDFRQDDLEWSGLLGGLGYRQITSAPIFGFKPDFRNLDEYCAALKSHYRKQVKRSLRKLETKGIEIQILTDPQDILSAYTQEAHNLFEQVRDRAEVRVEEITIGYLRELASQMSGQIELILLRIGNRIVAFGWCLHTASAYYMMYAGMDYALNEDVELYFNLHYAALDRAFRKQVSKIDLGATACSFKARLGCYSEPSYFFVKGLTPLMSALVRFGGNLLAAPQPAVPAFDIFSAKKAA